MGCIWDGLGWFGYGLGWFGGGYNSCYKAAVIAAVALATIYSDFSVCPSGAELLLEEFTYQSTYGFHTSLHTHCLIWQQGHMLEEKRGRQAFVGSLRGFAIAAATTAAITAVKAAVVAAAIHSQASHECLAASFFLQHVPLLPDEAVGM